MADIEWLKMPGYKPETWNPIAGCRPVSEGCRNCWAASMASRFDVPKWSGLTKAGRWTGECRPRPAALGEPLRWRKPRMVAVGLMGDLWHEDVPDEYIAAVYGVMAACPQHLFVACTKRPRRKAEWHRWVKQGEQGPFFRCFMHAHRARVLERNVPECDWRWPLPNVWELVSVEDQATADARIPTHLESPAVVLGASAEPLLGPVDMSPWLPCCECGGVGLSGGSGSPCGTCDGPRNELRFVIVGGESGPNARPMHPDWARSLRDQCAAAADHVAFFFKQWGEWAPGLDGHRATTWGTIDRDGNWFPLATPWNGRQGADSDTAEHVMCRVGKRAAGNLLDGRQHAEWP